ncbi:MAG: glycosyltransferase family 39 protein [Chloroflexi bacterium]|nr:glycosyltransferase family 39 protein [Chloroflexota bacterium]
MAIRAAPRRPMTASAVAPAATPTTLPSALRPGWRRIVLVAMLAIVVGVGFWLRAHDLGVRSLWVDELFSVGLAVQDLRTILTVLYGEEANMTLYYFVMAAWMRLVGGSASEVWVRIPSVLFGAAGVWALYRLGNRLDGRVTGLLAALLAAVNAYHIEMSQEARAYSMWAVLVTLSWDALLAAFDGGGRKAWLRYVAWTTIAFYTHFFTVFVIVAQVTIVAIRSNVREWRVLVASGICVAALCTPFLPFFVVNSDGSQILHVRNSTVADLLALLRLFAGASLPLLGAYSLLGVLGTAALLWPALRDRSRRGIGRALIPLFWLLVPVLTIFVLSYVKPMFKERYLFGAMPAFPLLAALGLAALGRLLRRPPLAALVQAVGAAALVWLAALPLLAGLEIRQSENWRGAAAYLEQNALPDDGWIFISKRGQLGYEYYAGWLGGGKPGAVRPDVLEGFNWDDLANSVAYYRTLESGTSRLPDFTARHPRVWLVLSHEYDSTFDGDTSEAVRNWFSRRGFSARQRTFQNIRIYLYDRRP